MESSTYQSEDRAHPQPEQVACREIPYGSRQHQKESIRVSIAECEADRMQRPAGERSLT
jgi:hypothetical protein